MLTIHYATAISLQRVGARDGAKAATQPATTLATPGHGLAPLGRDLGVTPPSPGPPRLVPVTRLSLWLFLGLTALWATSALHTVPTPTALDAVTADYHEDAPGAREVASVGARLWQHGAQRWLEVEVSARGPRVVPYPGLEGVHGTNLKTAQELHAICSGGRMRFAVRDDARREVGHGAIANIQEARLPTRRLRAEGSVEMDALTAAAWPATVSVRSDPLPQGAATFDVLVDDLSRLRVSVAHDRITAIESLGEPPLALRRDGEVSR